MSVTIRASELTTSFTGSSAHAYCAFDILTDAIVDSYGIASVSHSTAGGIPDEWTVVLSDAIAAPVCLVHVTPYKSNLKFLTTTTDTVDLAPYAYYDYTGFPAATVSDILIKFPTVRQGKIPYDDHYYPFANYTTVLANRICTLVVY